MKSKDDGPQFDFNASKNGRDEGIERVLKNTPEGWKAGALALVLSRPKELGELFKGEDFRAYAALLIGEPPKYRAWGGIWSGYVKKGLVIKTGEWVNCVSKKNHACTAPMYKWPPARGVAVVVSNLLAMNHGFVGRAADIDASAAEIFFLDDSYRPAEIGKALRWSWMYRQFLCQLKQFYEGAY